ncbi:MAG: hypothetical protein K8R87_07445 [Verrucomicrobia bacterium]|nr:hypothetical protein [Verrucomicrobiota bacterium]
MSSGAITLQCPHCGGVFLTLQHSGFIEICPHCAVAAPRSNYTASNNPVGLRGRSDLPSSKHEAAPAAVQSAAVASPPVLDTPFPLAPEIPSAPAPAVVQAAPATPTFTSASWPPPASAATLNDSSTASSSAVHASIPPVWPGLNLEPDKETTNPFPTETVPQAAEPEIVHRETPKRRAPWLTVTMLILLIGSVTWLAFQAPQPIEIPQTISPPPSITATDGKNTSSAPAPTTLPPEPAQEVKPAIPNTTPDELAVIRARAAEEHLTAITGVMLKGIEKAVTLSDRLQWIDATEAQQADIKRFFEAPHPKFEPLQWELSAGKVIVLPSGQETKLFRLTTAACKDGAILQVRDDGGKARVRWSLFEQSHEKTYDRFLAETNSNGPARWFTLLCQRAHSFELKGNTKDQWICFDAQGSLGAQGTGKIYINKESPVGRFMEPKTQWGQLYLVELLLVKMGIEGQQLNVVLDCAGLHGDSGRR